ncbi:hypothetical protein SAMN05216175_102221 [Neptunomonas qingdaonensis]|uniref:Uncharacterized protein n=1 Tax=Neptunomonas qingdaonensis TaxID=1045558 RepID=A0A1I2N162_9GAMM|nr:hypothetical protein SAMN05216175_102221 [Neptunomonas qingdaonensis]
MKAFFYALVMAMQFQRPANYLAVAYREGLANNDYSGAFLVKPLSSAKLSKK